MVYTRFWNVYFSRQVFWLVDWIINQSTQNRASTTFNEAPLPRRRLVGASRWHALSWKRSNNGREWGQFLIGWLSNQPKIGSQRLQLGPFAVLSGWFHTLIPISMVLRNCEFSGHFPPKSGLQAGCASGKRSENCQIPVISRPAPARGFAGYWK